MSKRRLENFGSYLQGLRKLAGFTSLDAVIQALDETNDSQSPSISKSMLSLYERGELGSVRPEVLQALSHIYRASYEDLAHRWFAERFCVSLRSSENSKILEAIEEHSLSLVGPAESDSTRIRLIDLEELKKTQKELPKNAQVGVAAINFLDDNTFFDMVLENLKRGIVYYYFMPETEHLRYKALLTRVGEFHPALKGKLDGKLTHFVPRPNLDFPVNYVVYVYPDGQLKAYIGLLAETQPFYFQEAGLYLTWRLYESFRWALTVAKDPKVRKALSEIELHVGQREFDAKKKSLAPLK